MFAFDFSYLIVAAVGVVGAIEWLKGFPILTKVPAWGWRILLFPISFLVSWAADGGVFHVLSNGIALLAITQIGYPLLISLPNSIITAFQNKISGVK